ncbi:hypothetical protein [Mycobacterium sp. Root265]|uniref:hypothetical protein n=1 Tax=Mycobacterium sp. Root265 TaxID=1736504 RepID=UPI000A9F1E31|nr:hypothetical protein [Mycobacterium sp. Root265]
MTQPPPPEEFGPPQERIPAHGNYPPPPGNYPPPQGNYPPPGYPVPGTPAFGAPAYRVGEAVSWAWNKFSAHSPAILIPTLVLGVIYGVTQFSIQAVSNGFGAVGNSSIDAGYDASFSFDLTGVVVSVLGVIATAVVVAVAQSAYLNGMIDIANGQPVEIRSFFKPRNVIDVVIASVLSSIIIGLGALLCIVPGVIATIMLLFTTVAILDRNISGTDGLGTSFAIAKANFGPVALTWLATVGITLLGLVACVVGLVVAYPVSALVTVFAYRTLTGGYLAPPTPDPRPE